ncbi:hypothetical protein DFS34DRAFT_41115 [Phlyctochytrium arcticum]|nr:hypothetical protein DFS34DRAFT_41115 [Phlyctochytrium arcticum]
MRLPVMQKSAKIALRKEMRSLLSKIPSETLQTESQSVVNRLLESNIYKQSRSISIYINMPTGEIVTRDIILDAFETGKKCYVPFCHDGIMDMIELRTKEDYFALPRNKFGIPEPTGQMAQEIGITLPQLDLIVVPGLAFDREGWRLGHGKGYYDQFLQRVLESSAAANIPPPKTVALALSKQITEQSYVEM